MSIPITIVTGFLGSGKTTLIRRLLRKAKQQQCRMGLIVNEMSGMDVDGMLMGRAEVASHAKGNLISLYGESVATPNMLPQLDEAIVHLAKEYKAEHIILETSGSTRPAALIAHLQDHPMVSLQVVLCLVDPLFLQQEFDHGKQVIPGLQRNLAQQYFGKENLLVEQVLFSTEVILTRADCINMESIQQIAQTLSEINPYVDIQAMQWGEMALEKILYHSSYEFQRVQKLLGELLESTDRQSREPVSGSWLTHRTLEDKRPFHPQRLWHCCHSNLGEGIHRSKGFFWIPGRDDVALLWNQSGNSIGLEVVNYWAVAALHDPQARLLPEEREMLKQKMAGYSRRFGDRRCELTIIGEEPQVSDFYHGLVSCLLTEQELEYWEEGGYFEDPWPTRQVEYV